MPVPHLLSFPNLFEKFPTGLTPTGESGREQLACISLYPGSPIRAVSLLRRHRAARL
jgi:hypothetical protein